ncbi:NAD(+) diphosphatase [Sphingomonas sp. BN140010]|uniref:NAD(+) diphosphatase n=1 Tax=Sphingomonas arvum TaxID=2992113 RepID=A0ABT3JBS5_9SPHN|nr:NAD(+) diphosphatase [Sphingomonas sp. BN140010]MCW3796369.1 NAD(+) diphosphatase [Sphingomonas sp. BN140010]
MPNGSGDLPPDAFFSGPGIDRSDLLRGRPEELARLAEDTRARQLAWAGGLPELDPAGKLSWQPGSAALFLGVEGEVPCFSALSEEDGDLRARFGALAYLDATDAPLFAAALSLSNWHRRHRFCANCGQESELVRGGWSRRCPACAAEHFPRVDPVVIMLAEYEGRLLLGRQPQYPPGRYSALAGFVEVGETIEAAVTRELGEEAGIAVRQVRYVASQPWPFPSSLMIGCTATALSDELVVDLTELDDARWFTRDEVAAALAGAPGAAFLPPPPFAIAHTLLAHWLEEAGSAD